MGSVGAGMARVRCRLGEVFVVLGLMAYAIGAFPIVSGLLN